MDNINADECIMLTPVQWNAMLGYERTDAIVQLCRKFSFFRRDRLTISEREQVLCSSGMENVSMDSLIIHGSVGSARNDVFLRLLRLTRLTLVCDMASNVVVSPQVGDAVPNVMLYPLVETNQVRSHRLWNYVFWAMRCGVLRKIERRRQLMRRHAEEILRSTHDTEDFALSKLDNAPLLNEDVFFRQFRRLLDVEQEEQNISLDLFHGACTEKRVSIASIVSNVPALLIVWASWDYSSLQWLRKNIFSIPESGKMENCVKIVATYLASIDNDPWLRTVLQFVNVPERVSIPDGKQPRRVPKRSQIVLINVDRDRAAALKSYNELLSHIQGWSSPEVSLLALWAGSEGLQSEIATELNVTKLPFFLATTPANRFKRKSGERRYPRLFFISSCAEEERIQVASNGQGALVEMRGSNTELLEWHSIKREERMCIASSISSFISDSDVPLRFEARVDRSYPMIESTVSCHAKTLRSETSSTVCLSGTISTTDLLKLKDELRVLSRVKNFIFDVRVIEPSAPIITELNPMTPTRYAYGSARNITCSECREVIMIDRDYHFRCIHCEQVEGVVCRRCFNDEKHPQHHVLLRVPTHADTTLHLLWGCSNVEPLSLFCGKLLTNISDTHIGVYCNSCAKLIQGKRWKCALCYQYDLCSYCDEKINLKDSKKKDVPSFENSENRDRAFATVKAHSKDHFYLCIRRGCGTEGDNILKPLLALDPLKTLLS